MRTILAPVAAALVACVFLSAHADRWESSPSGLESVEGNMSLDLIGREGLLRFQQIDTTSGPRANRNRVGAHGPTLLISGLSGVAEGEAIPAISDPRSTSTRLASRSQTVASRATSFGAVLRVGAPPVTTGPAARYANSPRMPNSGAPSSSARAFAAPRRVRVRRRPKPRS
ncbi:MAG: hypothetical protein AAF628_04735 [Planctomycetota bacterium]